MSLNWWTLALQAINILILVWLLGRFLFRPVMDAIAARQAATDKLLADAQDAKNSAEHEARALKAQNDGFLAETEKRRSQSRASIEAERQSLLAQAKAEAAAIVAQGRAAIDAESSRADMAWRDKAARLAAHMAETLLARYAAGQAMAPMLAALQAGIADLSEADRRRLNADGPPTIVTAAPLDETLQAAIAQALGGPAPVFAVDPALIAGIELRTPHIQLRSSWRADLDSMLATLKEDGHARFG